ncbi:MAG: ATP-dependent Clp protease proteolytic subunit [Micromonosporaceae bacterium]|nr:ATP-dependent Clp protease proteolytic subunit [Micromonosporaceae bacterium]
MQPEFPGEPRRDRPGRGPWTPPDPPGGGHHGLDPWLRERLFQQRLVMAHGLLTPALASDVAAQLLTLDAAGSEPVRLHLTCPDGDLGAAFALVDALDLMRASVRAVATGEVGGAALAVLAAAKERAAYPHARFRLAEPRVDDVSGTANEIVGEASRHLRMLEDLILCLADVTGRPRSRIETDLSDGRLLSAEQALEYGLLHEIVGPGSAGWSRPGSSG